MGKTLTGIVIGGGAYAAGTLADSAIFSGRIANNWLKFAAAFVTAGVAGIVLAHVLHRKS